MNREPGPGSPLADMAAEQGPDILNDGKNVVSPFMAGERGDAVLKTVFEPTQDSRRWMEGYLGRPLSPMSGLRNNVPASAQPPGLSAVRQPSKKNMPEMPASGKSRLPVIAGVGSGAGLALWPADSPDGVKREPGLEAPVFDPVDMLTAPVGAVTAAGRAASVLAEPVISWGMDKAGNWLGDRLGGLLGYFGGEE